MPRGLFGAAIWLGLGACGPAGPDGTGNGQSDQGEEQSDQGEEQSNQGDELATADGAVDDTEEDGSDDGDEDGSVLGFVSDFDLTAEEPCDQYAQDCPEGEKCVPYSSSGGGFDDLRCVPVLGDQAPGEVCEYDDRSSATDDCNATSYCWYVEDHVGECVALCLGAPDDPECPPGSNCKFTAEDVYSLCIPNCDPLAQDCGEDLGCFWTGIGTTFDCNFRTEDTPVGEYCGVPNDCAPGLVCLENELLPECEDGNWSCCTAFCDLAEGDAACEQAVPGTVCTPFVDDPPESEIVGVCVLES